MVLEPLSPETLRPAPGVVVPASARLNSEN